MQEFRELLPSGYIDADREAINKNFASVLSDFSGDTFPTTNLQVGMWCHRTDQKKIYNLTSTDPATWKEVFSYDSETGFITPKAANALTADKAVSDEKGQNITNTYVASVTASGTAVTVKKGDGSTTVFNTPNTTYEPMTGATQSIAGKVGLVPIPQAGQQGKFLRGDGAWETPANTTYNVMKGASSSAAGAVGLVPQPPQNSQSKFLRADAQWADAPVTNVLSTQITVTGSTQKNQYTIVSSNTYDETKTSGSGELISYDIRYYTQPLVTQGTYTLSNLLQNLVAKSHSHKSYQETIKYNCNCDCNCSGDDCGG